jgi:hypothetical protein
MKKLSFLNTCLFTLFISHAQFDSTISAKKQKSFIASIQTLDNKMIKGRLYAINDSQVVLVKSFNEQYQIPVENIRSFSLKRKNSVLKGALIGFGGGALTGIIIGFASGNDPVTPYPDPSTDIFGIGTFAAGVNNLFAMTAGQKAAAAGLGLGVSGAIIGTIVGVLAKKKFIIAGKRERFHDLQSQIMMKLVQT